LPYRATGHVIGWPKIHVIGRPTMDSGKQLVGRKGQLQTFIAQRPGVHFCAYSWSARLAKRSEAKEAQV
jgi:hypothetical protein